MYTELTLIKYFFCNVKKFYNNLIYYIKTQKKEYMNQNTNKKIKKI